MQLLKIGVLAILLMGSNLVAAESGQQHKTAMVKHANPMPNLMRIVKHHGEELKLTEAQDKALAQWREAQHAPMHEKIMQVAKLEKEMHAAALAGRNKAELMAMNARVLAVRRDIVSTKADCRDNMRRILTPKQFKQVVEIYHQYNG